MPKISKEESLARRNEIIDACEALYRSESYHDITMTQVASKVSFGRANVYNRDRSTTPILRRGWQKAWKSARRCSSFSR